MPFRITGTRAAQQDTVQNTQAGSLFGTNSTPTTPLTQGFGSAPNLTQGSASGSMTTQYASPLRRPGVSMGRM